jgi:hypothetical protein
VVVKREAEIMNYVEKFPQLVIVPNTETDSFRIFIKFGEKYGDTQFIERVSGIKWDARGANPDWDMAHPHIKAELKKKRIPNLPSAPTKVELIVMGAKHFFKDKEFVSRELVVVLKEEYPNYKCNFGPREVSGILQRSKQFDRRFVKCANTKMAAWKCIKPTEIELLLPY